MLSEVSKWTGLPFSRSHGVNADFQRSSHIIFIIDLHLTANEICLIETDYVLELFVF